MMPYESLVGLQIKNEKLYEEYRAAMKPLLEQHEGGFRYDFIVSETLKAVTPDPINRVFVIYFGSKAKMEAFFSHPEYLKIRQKYFEPSVAATTRIASYEREN